MVVVIVGNQNGHDGRKIHPMLGQPFLGYSGPDTGIDQDPVSGVPQVVTVPAAAAAKAEERKSLRWKKFELHTCKGNE
jgi:hypothetical protein